MSRLILIMLVALFLCSSYSYGQRKSRKRGYPAYSAPSKPSEDERFLQTQWWLGFKAGGNTSMAEPDQRFSGFSEINGDADGNQKEYDDFGSWGGQAGLEITLYHRGFSFSFQPNYRRQRFAYSNSYEWIDGNSPDNVLQLTYNQDHKLDYIEFPIFIKYDFTRGAARPFIQVGAYYATLISAQKAVEISGADYASGNAGPFENQKLIIGAEDLFIKSSVGVAGGVGLTYDVWNVRFVFDVTYRYGLNNIADVKNRYSENQLAGIGDALDDIMLRNVAVSLGCVFPLRFISNNYNATN